MKRNQIYSLINSMSKEIFGESAITVKDTASFLSWGSAALAEDLIDQVYSKLIDRIGKTIILYDRLIEKNLIKRADTIEFGSILQTIETKNIASAKENQTWVTGSNSALKQVDPFSVIEKDDTDLLVQYFGKRGTWEIDKVRYDYQLNDAFTSEVSFSAFADMVTGDMYNAMTQAKNDLQHGVLASAIGSCIYTGTKETSPKPAMARNLLHEYNTITSAGLTLATCLTSKEFLRFCAKEIWLAVKKLSDPSILYNELGAVKWTNEPSVYALSNYTTASDAYLSADTYHKNLVSLPTYEELNFWQAQGTDSAFETVSKIAVQVHEGDADTTGHAVEQSGIIAYICDPWRQGYMFDRIRMKSIYNPASECTTFFNKADQGFFINRARNGIVFYLAEA